MNDRRLILIFRTEPQSFFILYKRSTEYTLVDFLLDEIYKPFLPVKYVEQNSKSNRRISMMKLVKECSEIIIF